MREASRKRNCTLIRAVALAAAVLGATTGWVFAASQFVPQRSAKPNRHDVFVARLAGLESTADTSQRQRIAALHGAVEAAGQLAEVTVDYPLDASVFPPEMHAPTFLWHDASETADRWLVEVRLGDDRDGVSILVPGEPPPRGTIDERCISETNRLYEPTPYQASAKAWQPSAALWEAIKEHSVDRAASLAFYGYSSAQPDRVVSRGTTTLTTSSDPIGAPIFYRDVPLMPAPTKKGEIKPLAKGAMPLIVWRLRDVSLPESRVMLTDMPTCANCHSFSLDGKTMGMDVDGPSGDKGAYAVAPIEKDLVISDDKVITWNSFPEKTPGLNTLGFLSRVSPDGRFVVSTVNEQIYVVNFRDFKFGQVFYPTRGILAYYSRETGEMKALPGADDTEYVHCDPVWSPDGKWLIFARARARDPYERGQPLPDYAGDPKETPMQYDLYRMPFNEGRGGSPEPIPAASANGMSNTFPKVSPDGKWLVWVKCKNGQLMRPDGRLWIAPLAGGEPREMRCNTPLMNSWHSFSPNARWMVFSSKANTPYTQMFLTHIDEQGNDSPPILIENSTAANRAVNLPEFVNVGYEQFARIEVPAVEHYRYFNQGNTLAQQGRHREAVEAFERALEEERNDSRIHDSISKSLLQLGETERALEHIRFALTLNPYKPDLHSNAGYILSETGHYDEALEHLDFAIELDPDDYRAWYNRATLQLKRGDRISALADYTTAIRLNPRHADAYTGRGAVLRAEGDLAAALEDFTRVTELAPGTPMGWYGRALVRRDNGDVNGAIEDLTRALEVAPPGWPPTTEIESLRNELRASLRGG